MSHRVLIIDDDRELCELLCQFLELEGFCIDAVHDGLDALARCRVEKYDALVLDVMLPRLQGLELLRKLREFSTTPVLMLTARGADTDRIVGLELGADDYLPKPCNPRELAARLRAILRRGELSEHRRPASDLKVGATHLNCAERSVHQSDQRVELTSAEFNVLESLMRSAGEVVNRETLCQQALGRALTAYDRSVDVHVSNIRKKLTAGSGPELIKNIRGIGYQFIVSEIDRS